MEWKEKTDCRTDFCFCCCLLAFIEEESRTTCLDFTSFTLYQRKLSQNYFLKSYIDNALNLEVLFYEYNSFMLLNGLDVILHLYLVTQPCFIRPLVAKVVPMPSQLWRVLSLQVNRQQWAFRTYLIEYIRYNLQHMKLYKNITWTFAGKLNSS